MTRATRPSLTTNRPFLHKALSRRKEGERMTIRQLRAEAKAKNLAYYIHQHEQGGELFPE